MGEAKTRRRWHKTVGWIATALFLLGLGIAVCGVYLAGGWSGMILFGIMLYVDIRWGTLTRLMNRMMRPRSMALLIGLTVLIYVGMYLVLGPGEFAQRMTIPDH